MKKILLFFLSLLIIIFCKSFVYATDSSGFNANFDVTPVLPSNQIGNIGSYFNLQVHPDDKEDLTVRIHNKSDKPIIVEIDAANALNTQNGGIDYTALDKTTYSSFVDPTYALKNNIKTPNEVTLQANEIKDIPITVTVPNKKEGTVLGGILFSQKNQNDSSNKSSSKGVTILNKTVFSIAIYLHITNSTNGNIVLNKPQLSFLPSGILLLINLDNNIPSVANNISGNYQVYDPDIKKVFEGSFSDLKLAPKTSLSYPVFWNSETIKPGVYHLKINLNINGQYMENNQTFDVKSNDLTTYKKKVDHLSPTIDTSTKQTVNKNNNNPSLWMYISIGLFVVLLFVILLLILLKRKKDDKSS